MRPKILRLVILLTLLTGPAACGAKPEPTMPAIATEPATPSTAATTPEAEPTAAPIEAAPAPTATAVVPTTRPGAFSQEQLIEDARQLAEIIEVGPVYSETVARQIAAIINDLEYEPPTLSAASVVGRAVLEFGGEVASRTMTDLFEDADSTYRFEVGEFLLVADRLAELEKSDEACQVLKSYVRDFSETPEIRQKLAEYCE